MLISFSSIFCLVFLRGVTCVSATNISFQQDTETKRLLQLPEMVAPQIGILASCMPVLAEHEFVKLETPIIIRYTSYFSAIWWNCVAVYSATYKDSLTGFTPVVTVEDSTLHNTDQRVNCATQASATYSYLSLPGAGKSLVSHLESIGFFVTASLDTDVEECGANVDCLRMLALNDGYGPTIMGHIVAKLAYDISIKDGWNQVGTDSCATNCQPYSDTTGYFPKQTKVNGKKDYWQPMLESDGKGYFCFQQHVTPHIGERASFRNLPESDRINRVASPPDYTNSRRKESKAVIERMAIIDDKKKVEIELFDNKIVIITALTQSFIGKVLIENYSDNKLGSPGLILSFERYVHFVQAINAADYDAIVIAWKEKVNYNLVRPTTKIKARKEKNITTWTTEGVQTIPAKDFEAYIRVMPHSEYVSGSACLFQTQEESVNGYLERIGLESTFYPIKLPVVGPGESIVEPGVVPSSPIELTFPNVEAMNQVGSESRLNGGMHFEESVPAAKELCSGIAAATITASFALY